MSIVNTLKNLKTNLFGGPGNTGFSQPAPSKVQNIGMTPTAVLNNDPLRFGTYQFPKDVFENDQLGHYMVFYVNEQKRTKYDYGAPNAIGVDKFDNPIFANNVGTVSQQRRLDGKRYKTEGRSTSSDGSNLQFSDRNRRAKVGIDSRTQTTRRITDSIALYLPPSVRDTTTAEYENTSTGLVGMFAGKGLDFTKDFINKAVNDLYTAEVQWPWLYTSTTQDVNSGQQEYTFPTAFRVADFESFSCPSTP